MSGRIQNGARVLWTAPGGGLRDYAGAVVCHIPAGRSVESVAGPLMQGLAYAVMSTQIGALALKGEGKRDRYLVRCPADASPATVQYRCALASVIERQNPTAPREGT